MLRRSLVLAWMCITTCSAFAQNMSDAQKRALNELSGEMAECSVYLMISATCLEGNPDPRTCAYRKLNPSGHLARIG